MRGRRRRETQAKVGRSQNDSDLVNRRGAINIGIVHEQSPWTTHNGLRFAVEALSGGIVNADRFRVC